MSWGGGGYGNPPYEGLGDWVIGGLGEGRESPGWEGGVHPGLFRGLEDLAGGGVYDKLVVNKLIVKVVLVGGHGGRGSGQYGRGLLSGQGGCEDRDL